MIKIAVITKTSMAFVKNFCAAPKHPATKSVHSLGNPLLISDCGRQPEKTEKNNFRFFLFFQQTGLNSGEKTEQKPVDFLPSGSICFAENVPTASAIPGPPPNGGPYGKVRTALFHRLFALSKKKPIVCSMMKSASFAHTELWISVFPGETAFSFQLGPDRTSEIRLCPEDPYLARSRVRDSTFCACGQISRRYAQVSGCKDRDPFDFHCRWSTALLKRMMHLPFPPYRYLSVAIEMSGIFKRPTNRTLFSPSETGSALPPMATTGFRISVSALPISDDRSTKEKQDRDMAFQIHGRRKPAYVGERIYNTEDRGIALPTDSRTDCKTLSQSG